MYSQQRSNSYLWNQLLLRPPWWKYHHSCCDQAFATTTVFLAWPYLQVFSLHLSSCSRLFGDRGNIQLEGKYCVIHHQSFIATYFSIWIHLDCIFFKFMWPVIIDRIDFWLRIWGFPHQICWRFPDSWSCFIGTLNPKTFVLIFCTGLNPNDSSIHKNKRKKTYVPVEFNIIDVWFSNILGIKLFSIGLSVFFCLDNESLKMLFYTVKIGNLEMFSHTIFWSICQIIL